MAVSEPRPHSVAWSGALVWALIAILGLMFTGLTVYRVRSRDLTEIDVDKLRELSAAPLKADAEPKPHPAKGDWPQWRGPNRDGVSTETGLLTAWPQDGPKVLWSQPTGDGYSGVVVANGCAFTMVQDGEDEAVVCWDAAGGQERWRFKYPAHFRYPKYGDGPRSTPSIAGEYIFTVGGTGIMHCLKAFTTNPAGEKVWRKDLLADFGGPLLDWGICFSPLEEKGRVFIMPGGPGSAIAALDPATGDVRWKRFDDPASYSSPVAADLAGRRQVIYLTGDRLIGVTPDDGRLLWEFPWPPGLGHAPSSIATPLVIGKYVFISSGYDKGCALIHVEAEDDGYRASQVYKTRGMRTVFSSCVRQGDFLYGFDDTNLACLELRTGKRKWEERGFGKGSVALADGKLIILGERGTLALALTDPEEYCEVSRFQHSEQPSSWTVPVIAGSRLYVRDRSRLVCYDLKKSS
jgi:outer membrane protein assembly factor BamB